MVYYWGVFMPAINRARRRARMNYHKFILRSRKQTHLSSDPHLSPQYSSSSRTRYYPRRELLLDRLASMLAFWSLSERKMKRTEVERSVQLMWRDMNRFVIMQGENQDVSLNQGRNEEKKNFGKDAVVVARDGDGDVDMNDSLVSMLDSVHHAMPDNLNKIDVVPVGDLTKGGEQNKGEQNKEVERNEQGDVSVITHTDQRKNITHPVTSTITTDVLPDPTTVTATTETKRNKFLDRFISHVDAHAHDGRMSSRGKYDDDEMYVFPVELSRMCCNGTT